MKKDHRTTDGFDERAIDALLATLTDPGDDPAFRARVLAQVSGPAPSSPRAGWAWRALAGASLAAAVVAGGFLSWRALEPVAPRETRTGLEAPTAPAPDAPVPRSATAFPRADSLFDDDRMGEVPPGAASTRGTTGRPAGPVPVAAAREPAIEDELLPYGMERVRLDPVSIQPFALREVREDPVLAPLAPPDPVRVDPIDIEAIAPRR